MKPLLDEIAEWLPEAERRLDALPAGPKLAHIGTVANIGDDVARVEGLPGTRSNELLQFANSTRGLAIRIDGDDVDCVMLGDSTGIEAGSRVHGTGEIVRVPVGEGLLGRIVDPTGAPLDDGPHIDAERFDPIDRPAPGIVDRDLVDTALVTGQLVVDAMIPLGRGQRTLIIGDRKTGKTTIAVDTVISQRDTDVVCVYACVGQKSSTVTQIVEAVRKHGVIDRCVFVVGAAEAAPGLQWITPYAACTIAEYFRDRGQDALLIIDDLTKHAIIYRQLSLLLRKPPGREAYPGDMFYAHARLLERAAKMSDDLGGGSLTALPIAETQAENLTAYIPTNLISITDGQIYLEPKLFYEGQKPAVNVGMSVSRVGGHSQAQAMKHLAERLRLAYAQFLELEVFTRFGAMVDERTTRAIAHGRRIRAVLSQPAHRPLSVGEQVALLLALEKKILEDVPLENIADFKDRLRDWLRDHCAGTLTHIEETGELGDAEEGDLTPALTALAARLTAPGKSG